MKPAADFDFVVIGAGSAGYAAARTAADLGLRTAVVDGAAELGGLCILRGCMPSKTLIESADRSLSIRRAAEFGLRAAASGADIAKIRQRKRALIRGFAEYRQSQLESGRFVLYRGAAGFRDAHTIQIDPRDGSGSFEARAKCFCIATGSVASAPDIPGLHETGFWTSDEVLDADQLPDSFAVLGGGAIALELAHYLEGVGCEVSIIQRGTHLLTGLPPEISAVIERAYGRRGVQVFCGTRVARIGNPGDGKRKRIEFMHGAEPQAVEAAEILLAMGRRPNVAGLGLELAGVKVREGKIEVSDTMQTSQPHVFAAGDVCTSLEVVHVAVQEGEIAARNAFELIHGRLPAHQMDHRLALFGVFSHPQVAKIGANEQALAERGIPFESASYPFDDHGKSMVMGETEGFVKMTAHRATGEILGACCVGPQATEIIHEVAVAMRFRSTAQEFLKVPHYHPTLSEIWTYPAEELAGKITNHKSQGSKG